MSLEEFGNDANARVGNKIDSTNCPSPAQTSEDLSSRKKDPSEPTQWALCGPHQWSGVGNTKRKLIPGKYCIGSHNGVIFFEKMPIFIDDLLEFPDSLYAQILSEIEIFWDNAEKFDYYGFLQRLGFMFYGPAGSGKTCLVQLITAGIIRAGGIVLQCHAPDMAIAGLVLLRQIEPTRRVACMFEDIDAIINRHGESSILSMLDGENQVNHVLNIATTNYPEKLDKRLVARPRRFDRVIKIGMPSRQTREVFFTKKLRLDNNATELQQYVDASDEFSFAAMADLVISTKCLGQPFNKAVKAIRDLMENKPKSSDFDAPVGFGGAQKGYSP